MGQLTKAMLLLPKKAPKGPDFSIWGLCESDIRYQASNQKEVHMAEVC